MGERGLWRRASSPSPGLLDAAGTRLVANIELLSALCPLTMFWIDARQGLVTPWDRIGLPALSATLAFSGLLLHWRARWLHVSILLALTSTALYLQGLVHFALRGEAFPGVYSIATGSQFMPLVYLGAFVALRRGAALLSWLHYVGLAAQFLAASLGTGPQGPEANLTRQALLSIVVAHPLIILSLTFITHLRDGLHRAQLDAFHSKERFLAMLSHEIRTPLQTMLGAIDLLALKMRGGAASRAIDRLRSSATQLEAHLRDLTEFTRLEDPSLRVQCSPFDLVQLLGEVREEWLVHAAAKGLTLVLEADTHDFALRHVVSDRGRIRQLLVNLTSNAVKYTLQGRIVLRAIAVAGPSPEVVIEVEDTGIGIDRQHLDNIFKPFVRLEDTQTLRAEGSGLGLAVVRRIADRLGARLSVSSQPGQGSVFRLVLPVRAMDPSA